MAIIDERVTMWGWVAPEGETPVGTGELHVFFNNSSNPANQIDHIEVQNQLGLFPVRIVLRAVPSMNVIRDQTFPATTLTTLNHPADFPNGTRYLNNHSTRATNFDVSVVFPG